MKAYLYCIVGMECVYGWNACLGTGSLALKINEQKLATGLFYERNDREASAECNGGVEEGKSSQNDPLIY